MLSAVAANIAPNPKSAKPAPTIKTAAPKAIKPKAPAVNTGPKTAAPIASATIATTIANITAIAPQPAAANDTAACASKAKPAHARKIPRPRATIAAAKARI